MYVIFPADEVVYLSYGRIIYVPSTPQLDNPSAPPPIRTTSPVETINQQPSIPSTTSSSTKSRKSTISEPIFSVSDSSSAVKTSSSRSLNQPSTSREHRVNKTPVTNSDSAPVRPERKKKSFRFPILSKPKTPLFERKYSFSDLFSNNTREKSVSNSDNTKSKESASRSKKEKSEKPFLRPNESFDEITTNNFERFNSLRLEKPPLSLQVPKEKDKGLVRQEHSASPTSKSSSSKGKTSPSNFNRANSLKKDNSPTTSHQSKDKFDSAFKSANQPSSSKEVNGVKIREKSPVIRFFRDKANSTGSKERPVIDFDSLFNRDITVGKLSSGSFQNIKEDNSSKNAAKLQQQSAEKTTEARRRAPVENVQQKRSLLDPVPINPTTSRMASNDSALKDLTHPGYNENLKIHNSVAFKLVRTVSDFTQQLGQMYEQHAEELQMLVANFRKRNGELRKERPACPSSLFHTWETLLQEVEIDSQALGDIASILGRQVSRPLLERSFHRKIQSRKVFTHRESYETIIAKTEEKLVKCRQEYKNSYLTYLVNQTPDNLGIYLNCHNAYVQQLHATNGMMEEYGKETLPSILQELEEIYTDLCSTVADAVLQGAEVVSSRAMEQCRRYEGLVTQCKSVSGAADLAHLARSLPTPTGRGPIMKRIFVPPQPPPPPDPVDGEPQELQNENLPPILKDELIIDKLSVVQVKPSHDALKKEAMDLEAQIRQIQDALDTLLRIQQKSVEANLYNKANELQEDISMKRFDLRVAQLHLSAINSQKELFTSKLESDAGRERKMSAASTGSMKNKWLKAFKSLKTPPPETEKKNGSAATRELLKGDPDAHNFQENTYKKITPCDVCGQVLRGHTRQGLKCRICKMNVHLDCQDKASKCQTKARLLRRQKSTSEIETRVGETTVEEEKSPEVDQIYQVLKQATEISNSKPRVNIDSAPPGITVDRGVVGSNPGSSGSSGQSLNRRGAPPIQPSRAAGSTLAVINPAPCATSSDRRQPPIAGESSSMRRRLFAGMKSLTGFGSRSRHGSPGHRSISLPETPHSPRRQKLNLRMKSLSLDSPESTEHVQRRKHHGANTASDPHSTQSSSSRIQSPSSPVHNRKLLSAKNIRMSSVELPDDNEKSPSSASTSPCPSPVGGKKSHRLLPTNLYVVLYNFKSRHQDELDLKAGYKVTVIDTSDPDWWKGKCLGRVGFFPSKYVSKLSSGEKPLQVTHNLQVTDGDNGLMLLRDQIVIQIGEEVDGMVMIRSGDNRQGICPVKFLQEV